MSSRGSRRHFLRTLAWSGALAALPRAASGREPPPTLRFEAGRDFARWQTELRARLLAILAVAPPVASPLEPAVDREADSGEFTLDRIGFLAEPGERVSGYLLRPRRGRGPFPVMICLQGHSPGMHLSIGRARNEAEQKLIAGGRDLALQSVAHGWAALVIEQRAFGVRAAPGVRCNDAALHALHRGRPLTGQRVLDVTRAIDFAATQPDLDLTRLGCIGNSTGGTVSFYAACVDPRISLAVVSCSFCTFEDSWLELPHCACGYLPGIMTVADMPDLAGLIAPRRLLIVAGRHDPLAHFAGVEKGYHRTREIFAAAGCPEHVRLVAGGGGHQFYPDLAWPVVADLMPARPAAP